MKIATILFTWNRSYHTDQVLTALKRNTVLPEKLFVFQDGLREGANAHEWKTVNGLIHNIDWCEKEIIVSEYNRGLAASIVAGINYVFEEYDAAIILEDDCVPTANFINYMQQCFEKYEDDERIYSVSGYAWPIELPQGEYDIYGCGRVSSWGWGTWKDRWKQYSTDSGILRRIKKEKNKSQYLATWASNCEQSLLNNVSGKNDSWAVYWALCVIENNAICINPYHSLIQNIGLDGTGVHCGTNERFHVDVSEEIKDQFILPDHVNILHTTEVAFADLYGSYTAVNSEDSSKETILVYGLGNFYFHCEKEINEDYNIQAFIDRGRKGWYAGKKIIRLDEIKQYVFDKIIIMVQDVQECIHIAKDLIDRKIDIKCVVWGFDLYGKHDKAIESISILPDGNLLVTFNNISIKVTSKDEFNNVCEVFINQIYNYSLNNGRKDIVIDIGMNIGDATLYFANLKNVEKVYGYEPFKDTFLLAEENLEKYLNVNKVDIFPYGISNENISRIIGFNSEMTCGQSTLGEIRERQYKKYLSWGLVNASKEKLEQINVKKASEVFEPIIKKYPNYNVILKMDCEGEEYGIIEELFQSGTLEKFTFIMLEWHYHGKGILLRNLEKAGFSWWCNDKNDNMGLIYAYRLQGIMDSDAVIKDG